MAGPQLINHRTRCGRAWQAAVEGLALVSHSQGLGFSQTLANSGHVSSI